MVYIQCHSHTYTFHLAFATQATKMVFFLVFGRLLKELSFILKELFFCRITCEKYFICEVVEM